MLYVISRPLRKVCGFSNYNALKGCSKCLKDFPTERFGSKPDYSGYDFESWPKRKPLVHVEKGIAGKGANTPTARHNIERSYGCKYSVLYDLPAFDVVQFHVVDPMHNLFLGLAKYTTKQWKNVGVLSNDDYAAIQSRVDSMIVPSKVGRIPRKIASNFVAFTADEWKHWTLIYSSYALHGILPDGHYRCWCTFVRACRYFLQAKLTAVEVRMAHLLLVQFCVQFQQLYGTQSCTPNLHMAYHLEDCILDYGVLSSFWCFPFERLNGVLEGMKKSWILPEKQMFNKFINLQNLSMQEMPSEFRTVLCKESIFQHDSTAG